MLVSDVGLHCSIQQAADMVWCLQATA